VSEILASAIMWILLAASASAEVLHDPMRPFANKSPVERSFAGKAYALSAILYSADRRVAVINGQSVSENERINGARVKHIYRGRVVLEVNGEILKLELSMLGKTK